MADVVEMMPEVTRIDGFTVEFKHNDYCEIFDAIEAISILSRSVKW